MEREQKRIGVGGRTEGYSEKHWGREQARVTDENDNKEKDRDGEQHGRMEKAKEVSGALQGGGGRGKNPKCQGAAERDREIRDGQEEGQGQRHRE